MGGGNSTLSTSTDSGIYEVYEMGLDGNTTGISTAIAACSSPAEGFACLAAYYAGQEDADLDLAMDDYTAQHDAYIALLEISEEAATNKATASENSSSVEVSDDYIDYVAGEKEYTAEEDDDGIITKHWKLDSDNNYIRSGGLMTQDDWEDIAGTRSDDVSFDAEGWDDQCTIINEEKEIQSTELNKLSTDMELTVEDSSTAQEMTANAVKKNSDLASTQGRTSGG